MQYITVHLQQPRITPMATTKTATVTFRIDPSVNEALRTAAAREHRSIANMVDVFLRDYCDKNNISINELQAGNDREVHLNRPARTDW